MKVVKFKNACIFWLPAGTCCRKSGDFNFLLNYKKIIKLVQGCDLRPVLGK